MAIRPSFQRVAGKRSAKRIGKNSRQHKPAASSRKGATRKSQQSLETRDRLLNSAEALFAKHGLYGVTVRNVAQHARVDTALVYYYFGTKRGMFDAVFQRRADGINEARTKAMQAYEQANAGDITVSGAIRAFLTPIFDEDRHADPGWRHFSALVALANNSQEWGGEMMSRYFDVVIHQLIRLLQKAIPGAKKEDLYWSYQMLSGALMVLQAGTGRVELLSDGLCRSDDIDAFGDRLIEFATAGFTAVCTPRRR